MGKAGVHGPEIIREEGRNAVMRVGSFRWEFPDHFSPEDVADPVLRLKLMDERGIDIAGVSVTPPFYLYWIDHDLAISFTQAVNDSLARFCSAAPDRLFFMASLPFQDPEAAVAEIVRATTELGAKGLNMGYNPCGRSMADAHFYPVYERAESLRLPIFMHPLAEGQEGDPGDKQGEEATDWHKDGLLQGVAGFLNQETLAVARLMLGGVFDDFPGLNFCIPHGGGAIPYQFGRFAEAARREPVKAKKPIVEYLHNFYFDTVVHDLRARRLLVEVMGADNVVVGSNLPGWDAVDGFKFTEELGLDKADEAKIMGGNAARLFKL
jgi:aminocarboxymuconate-semialdehyde decarboxylase